jgi:hypothetical protein
MLQIQSKKLRVFLNKCLEGKKNTAALKGSNDVFIN